jgi:hypothetical protein
MNATGNIIFSSHFICNCISHFSLSFYYLKLRLNCLLTYIYIYLGKYDNY